MIDFSRIVVVGKYGVYIISFGYYCDFILLLIIFKWGKGWCGCINVNFIYIIQEQFKCVFVVGKMQVFCKVSCYVFWCGKVIQWWVIERYVGDGNIGIFCEVKYVLLVVYEVVVNQVILIFLNFVQFQVCFINRVNIQVNSGVCLN